MNWIYPAPSTSPKNSASPSCMSPRSSCILTFRLAAARLTKSSTYHSLPCGSERDAMPQVSHSKEGMIIGQFKRLAISGLFCVSWSGKITSLSRCPLNALHNAHIRQCQILITIPSTCIDFSISKGCERRDHARLSLRCHPCERCWLRVRPQLYLPSCQSP